MTNVANLLTSIAADILTGLPKDAAATLVGAVLQRRRRAAFEILLKELRRGTALPVSPDEGIPALLRYQRAADEGAARRNLRLMAMVIAGHAFKGNLKADEFLHYADMLAAMRREEIILLATLFRIQKAWNGKEGRPSPLQQWSLIDEELIPNPFPDKEAIRATAMACLRTGLLADDNTMDDAGWYMTTKLMDQLQSLAPFESALDEDDPPLGSDTEKAP